jgi:nitrate/nitrite transporter NarK
MLLPSSEALCDIGWSNIRGWAAGFALVKMLGGAGSFCGPVVMGALMDSSGGSFTPAMLFLSACMFAAAIMHLLFREPGGRNLFISRSVCRTEWERAMTCSSP